MKFHLQQAVRALILLAFSGLLFKLHFTEEITKFINPKYVGLSQAASVLFLFLFFIQTTRIWTEKTKDDHHCHHDDHSCDHDHGESTFTLKKLIAYIIVIFPLVTGFVLPAKVLDASIFDKKGGMAILSKQNQSSQGVDTTLEQNIDKENKQEDSSINNPNDSAYIPEQKEISNEEYEQLVQKLLQNPNIVMQDTVFNTYYEEISKDISKFKGRKITLKGFVYKEEGFVENQLVISRFLITHCVADATIIGFLSELEEASSIDEDTWVEAEGILNIITYNGTELPFIKITEWKKISAPKDPYIYPINIKIL
jgi:putative membrane protein